MNWKGFLLYSASAVALVLFAGMVLSVNLFPSVTDDSLHYLGHSRDFSGYGWVQHGTRQFGYPMYLATVRIVSDVIGSEPLFSSALVQRLLLILAGFLAWRQWRWYSIPFLVFLFSAQTLAFTNFLLNEGLALPLTALMTIPTWIALRSFADRDQELSKERVLTMVALVSVGALALYTFKFTFVGFATLPVVFVLASWGTELRRQVLAISLGFFLALGGITLAMSSENLDELQTFRPTFDAGAASYYYAWKHVFADTENREKAELQRFWDDGSLADFLADTQKGVDDPRIRAERRADEVAAMLAAAGISPLGSQIESFLFGMAGGRIDDVDTALERIVEADRGTVDRPLYMNGVALAIGHEAFDRDYNDGMKPQALVTDPIGLRARWLDSHILTRILLPISLLVAAVALFSRRRRFMALAVLAPMILQALGLGLIRADNFRFLIATAAFAIGTATSLVYDYVTRNKTLEPAVQPTG